MTCGTEAPLAPDVPRDVPDETVKAFVGGHGYSHFLGAWRHRHQRRRPPRALSLSSELGTFVRGWSLFCNGTIAPPWMLSTPQARYAGRCQSGTAPCIQLRHPRMGNNGNGHDRVIDFILTHKHHKRHRFQLLYLMRIF